LREDILESGGRDDRRGGLEERAAVEGHGGMVAQRSGNRELAGSASPANFAPLSPARNRMQKCVQTPQNTPKNPLQSPS
jgi:hypothetical protein